MKQPATISNPYRIRPRFPHSGITGIDNTTKVAVGIWVVNRRMMLMRRTKGADKGKWGWSGGKVDDPFKYSDGMEPEQRTIWIANSEWCHPERALVRELDEELDIQLTDAPREPFHKMFIADKDNPGKELELHFYLLQEHDIASGTLPETRSAENHEIKWAAERDMIYGDDVELVDVNREIYRCLSQNESFAALMSEPEPAPPLTGMAYFLYGLSREMGATSADFRFRALGLA